MTDKSLLEEIKEINIAMELIVLGARMQVVESETQLSHRRLLRLYKELKGCSPPKGLLPFSPDWFMAWEQNIHSSMFYNIYLYVKNTSKGRSIENTLKAYRLYREQFSDSSWEEPVLGFTRAWTLVRFVDCGMVVHTECSNCHGLFISTPDYSKKSFTCSLCCTPSRAIKRNKNNNLKSYNIVSADHLCRDAVEISYPPCFSVLLRT